jgi:hypothetical protein
MQGGGELEVIQDLQVHELLRRRSKLGPRTSPFWCGGSPRHPSSGRRLLRISDALFLTRKSQFAKLGFRGRQWVASEKICNNLSWVLLLRVIVIGQEAKLGPEEKDGRILVAPSS